MSMTEPLRKDHEILRQQLEALEAELQAVPTATASVQQLCHSLARFVEGHMAKEEQMFAPYAHRFGPGVRQHLLGDHTDEWMLLHELDMLFTSNIRVPTSELVTRLGQLVEQLRDHLDLEERSVFPVIDRAEQEMARRVRAGAAGDTGT